MIEDKMIIGNGGTPLTVADAVIRECPEKEWLEDVIYFIQAYIDRTFPAENKAESEENNGTL